MLERACENASAREASESIHYWSGGLPLRFLTTLALLAAALCSFAQIDPNRVVATVNGVDIRGADYYRRMEFLTGVGKRMGNTIAEAPPGFLTIDTLINEELLLQLAKQKAVSVTNAEVQAELQSRQQASPTFVQNWTANGRTLDELKRILLMDLTQFKLATFGVTITDQELERFYKDNPTRFTLLKSAKLRVIAVSDEAARDKVDTALKAGRTFPGVATEYSDDITRASGGDLGKPVLAMLPSEVQAAIAAIKIGQVTAWVKSANVWTKFLLEDVYPERLLPLDTSLRSQIRRQLMLDKGAVRNDVPKEIQALRLKSAINIKEKQFSDTYNSMMGRSGG